jgi:selT/selW/selH-like putative selenoprotein
VGDQLPGGVSLVPGRSGSFEVTYNGELVFSKLASDRFPEENEVEGIVQAKIEREEQA